MATLPSLRPNGTVSSLDVTIVNGSTIHGSLSDYDPSDNNASDTTYIFDAGTTDSNCVLELDSTPSDFLSMGSTLTVRAVTQAVNYQDDTDILSVQITDSSGTALTDSVTLSIQTDSTKAIRTASLTVNATGLAASKATWDDARLVMSWAYSASMSRDNIEVRVWSLEVDGTYTQATNVTFELYENGVFKATLGTTTLTGSEIIEFEWDAADLTLINGVNVELRISSNLGFDVGAVEWLADFEPGAVVLPATANGSSSTSGSATARRRLRATASGSSTTAGSAAAKRKLRATASGASTSSGTAAARRKLQATASGASTSSGSAQAQRRLRATASGVSTTSGSANARKKYLVFASGASITVGSAEVRTGHAGAASGSSTTVGSASAKRRLRAVASGASSALGSALARVSWKAAGSGSSTTAGSAAAGRVLVASASGSSSTSGTAFAIVFAQAAIPPNTILAVTNLPASPVTDIDDDPDAPDGSWLVATSTGVATNIRVGFASPSGDLMTGPNRQKIRLLARAR